MRTTLFVAAFAFAASASADSVPAGIAPDASPPDGCSETSKTNFTIGYTLFSSMKRESAIDAGSDSLQLNLTKGILKDREGRIGSIVSNYQFQFDGPPQAGAIYTGGFSVCTNTSLALGNSTRWWKCESGDFYNLYDRSIGTQCDEIRIVVTYDSSTSSSSSSSAAASSTTSGSSGSTSTSAGASTTPSSSANGTATATTASSSSSSASSHSGSSTSASATARTSSSSSSAPAPSAAAPGSIRVPGAETFGAVIGIFGAALLL